MEYKIIFYLFSVAPCVESSQLHSCSGFPWSAQSVAWQVPAVSATPLQPPVQI